MQLDCLKRCIYSCMSIFPKKKKEMKGEANERRKEEKKLTSWDCLSRANIIEMNP